MLAEATLTFVLFADASRIDLRLLRREVSIPVRLLGIGLPLTIVAGTIVAALVFPGLSWPEALVLAIVLAPTDAALGQAVVTDGRLPSSSPPGPERRERSQRRHLRAAALHRARDRGGRRAGGRRCAASRSWPRRSATASSAAWPQEPSPRSSCGSWSHGGGAEDWLQVIPLAAAALAYGMAAPLGGSGFIAAFVGGMVFGGLRRPDDSDVGYLTDATGLTLAGVTFSSSAQ